jgi:hypothetical protein
MGGVHYTVPLDTFTWNLRKYLEEFNTEIVAPIGSFEIHPSRESLIFRTETVKRLTTLYTTALENLLSQYNNILEVQPTFAKAIELTRAVHAGISYLRRNLSFHDPIVWCGIDLEKVALPETIGVKSIKIQHWRRQNLVKFDKIYEKGSEATIDLLETLPKSDKFIFLNGRISIKQYAIDNKLTEHGGLVFTGDFEDAKWFVEDLLGYELIVLNRAPKKQNASVSRTPQTISSTYEYTCFGTEIGEASLSAESLCELRDAGVVFIRCSSIDDVEKQAEKLTSWLNLKLLALHREIVFVYMPESHKRIRQQFRFQALSDVLTDSILVTRNARQLAMYAALRKVHADYTTPASWLIGHLNEINEEDAWMLERAQAVECFRQEASNTFPPVPIVADDSWMEYYIEVNAHAQRVLRKYTDLIDVLSELWSHQAEPRRKKIIQWYIGANS